MLDRSATAKEMATLDDEAADDLKNGILGNNIEVGTASLVTIPNISATKDELLNLARGTLYLYVFSSITWADESLASDEY
jgi:hypothetical protein